MSERYVGLEETLITIGSALDFPSPPDAWPQVQARIAAGPRPVASLLDTRPQTRSHDVSRQRGSRLAAAALALAVLTIGILLFSPSVRHAVASWLGLPGIRISTSTKQPATIPGSGLRLGRRTTLAQAGERLGTEVVLPSAPGLGAPDGVFVEAAHRIVWLSYRPAPGLPPIAGHNVGLLITEIRARGLDGFFYKKLAGNGTEVKPLMVNGGRGFWIHGQPHVIQYRFPFGVRQELGRTSGNSLIWVRAGITYRIELQAGLKRALQIADSMR
jgi:hypothetical protein